MKTLSIIMPCFNEKDTIVQILNEVDKVDLKGIKKELIIVDDCSTDGTTETLKTYDKASKVLFNKQNRGKGYSIKKALKYCTGDYVIIQDADVEYDPNEYPKLLEHVDKNKVIYGSRIASKEVSSIWFYWGGVLVTKITNLLYKTSLTDQPTCYKLFHTDVLTSIELQENRFGFCAEVTAKIAKKGITIKEVPISYYPRKKHQGKKISWKDGLRAIYVLYKYY